ncbi:hypothetical protein C0992_008459 [Termitomyces sp. T32_za158]|nr:hypothetical protein C0992_008459 [Termitomyces sp. T32_za158]
MRHRSEIICPPPPVPATPRRGLRGRGHSRATGPGLTQASPVSVLPVQAKRRLKSKQVQQQPPSPPSSIWRLLRRTNRDRTTTAAAAAAAAVNTDSEKLSRLQVSVLIAMPSPNKPTNRRSSIDKHSDDDFVPNVVFGVTRIPYKHATRQ